jgi:hypothetical protein
MNSPLRTRDLLEFHFEDPVEAAHWDELVDGSPNADFYHLAAYVLASGELEHSQTLGLMIASSNRSTISYRCCCGHFPAPMGGLRGAYRPRNLLLFMSPQSSAPPLPSMESTTLLSTRTFPTAR